MPQSAKQQWPKTNLGFFPTPFHELPNLSALYPENRVFIKRDDLTGLATGGNKTRKLEYLIGDALTRGANTIITAGAQQSNHCRQTAAACAMKGLKCHLLLGGQEPETYTGNLLLSHLLGANIHFTGENRKGEGIQAFMDKLRQAGDNPYEVPYGGSNLTGAMGFVEAAGELQLQLKEHDIRIDYIFFASSSGAMQAGLMLGMELYGLEAVLMPINIDKEELADHKLENHMQALCQEGKARLALKDPDKPVTMPLIHDFDKAGYGVVTENETDAIRQLARHEGIILDPVYTARAYYGMMHYLGSGLLKKQANVLFWHTGGIPATLHYTEDLTRLQA
ncbi:MAG: 1-aminocyclopropane-1-carboxylate deaminase/D-cysteine desulfhydrase [Bacteroidales bacterium]